MYKSNTNMILHKYLYILIIQIVLLKQVYSSSPSEPDPDGSCVQLTTEMCLDRNDCKLIEGETCCGEKVQVCGNAEADCESSGQYGCFEVLGVRMTLPFCNPTIFDLFDPNPQCEIDGTNLCTSNITRCSQKLTEYCESNIYTSCCSRSAICSFIPNPPIVIPETTEPPYTPQPTTGTPCEEKSDINDCLSQYCSYEVISGCCGASEVVCVSKDNICNYDSPKCGYTDFNSEFLFLIPTCSFELPYVHEYDAVTPNCFDCPNTTECGRVPVDICDDHICCFQNEECIITNVYPTPPTPPPIFTTTSEQPTMGPDSSDTTTGGSSEVTTLSASTIDTTTGSTIFTTIVSTISTSTTIAEVTTASTIREITTSETTIASTIQTTTATTLASTSLSSTTFGGTSSTISITSSTTGTTTSASSSESNICDDLVCPPNYQCKIIHNGQSGICVPHSKCHKPCHHKDQECRIINGKERCVPKQCLDCSDLGCDKQGLICKMVKSSIYSDHVCSSTNCCEYTPTCLSKRTKYPYIY